MTIGEVGGRFSLTKKINYLSNDTLLEYDVLIIDLDQLSQLGNQYQYDLFEKRKKDLIEFYTHKEIPIIVFNKNNNIRSFYGMPASTPSSLLPAGSFKLTDETGNTFDILSQTHLTDFFKKYSDLFQYKSYFSSPVPYSTVALQTKYTKKTISCYTNEFVFIPTIIKRPDDEQAFLKDLINTVKSIRSTKTQIEYPEWSKSYYLPTEKDIALRISTAQKEIEEKNKELVELNKKLQLVSENKILLVGTGDVLENKITEILKEIGFEILEVENSRDDIIAKYGERVMVVEVKGVAGSAAEKHAAQLEKWVSTYIENNEITPKGLLVVNAFKDTELSTRGDVFPHQMLKFSTQREHCLLSTIQLLGIYYEVQNKPERKEELINSLFDTVGIYQDFADWKAFIEQ